jgi:phosphatidylglycerophosphatase A
MTIDQPSEIRPTPYSSTSLKLARDFCALGFAGRMPVSGTVGSAVAALLAPFLFMPLPFLGRLAWCAFLFVLGAMAATAVEKAEGEKDPGIIVIDELVGQWITFLPFAALSFWGYFWGFVLFRVFDILKPWPVRRGESAPDGYGVMLDDALAGIYAMLCLWIMRMIWPAL